MIHVNKKIISEIRTAADATSLAKPDSSWCSRLTLSTTASIAEFNISTIKTTNIGKIRSTFSIEDSPSQ
jgi:hypothetical protein